MRRLAWLIVLALCLPVWGGSVVVVQRTSTAPACAADISDDFSGTLSNWTADDGTWGIEGGALEVTANEGNDMLRWTGSTVSEVDRWICTTITEDSENAGRYHGMEFRADPADGDPFYSFQWETGSAEVIYVAYWTIAGGCARLARLAAATTLR